MNINRENYEAYYLDFMEGNLDEKEIAEFNSFLAQNPDLQLPRQDVEINLNTLETKNVIFEHKNFLKDFDWNNTMITEENIFLFQLARLDLLLSFEKLIEIELFEEKFPEWKLENELLKLTRLKPDEFIVFKEKTKLKRPFVKKKTILLYSVISSAACIVLFLIWKNNITENQMLDQPKTKNIISNKNNANTILIDRIHQKEFITKNEKQLTPKSRKSNNSNELNDVNYQNKELTEISDKVSENSSMPIKNPKDSIFENPIYNFSHESIKVNNNIVELTHSNSTEKAIEIETKKFTLFSKLLSKYLNIRFGVGKKVKENSEEYYVYIGSFQVSRKISR